MSFEQAGRGGFEWSRSGRSIIARVLWFVVALIAGVGGIALIGAGTFAPPEMDRVRLSGFESYYVDAMKYAYLVASAAIPASCFSAWKASHRGGLGFWRATARPALLAASAAAVAAGLTASTFFLPGRLQLAGLNAAGLGAVIFLFLWILRGPTFSLSAADGYWNKAFAAMFLLAGLISSVGTVGSIRQWSRQGYAVAMDVPPFQQRKVMREHWDSESEDMRSELRVYSMPRPIYNPLPIGTALMALVAVGSFSEARYRMGLVRRAKQVAFDKLF